MREVLTIQINLPSSFRDRIILFPLILSLPFKAWRTALFAEYREWCVLNLLDSSLQKILYIADHSILWPFYCLWALLWGEAHGFSWERSYDCDVPGVQCLWVEKRYRVENI